MMGLVIHAGAIAVNKSAMIPGFTELRVQLFNA